MCRMPATESPGRLALVRKGRRRPLFARFRTRFWIFLCNIHFLEYAVMAGLLSHIRALVC